MQGQLFFTPCLCCPLQGTSVCQASAIGAMVILLYVSRACYNLVVVALSPQDRPTPFNYGWYSVSDQVPDPIHYILCLELHQRSKKLVGSIAYLAFVLLCIQFEC